MSACLGHEGPHTVLWNDDRDNPVRELVERVVVHAPDASDADVDLVYDLIRRARAQHRVRMVELSDEEYATVTAVVRGACEYMFANSFADDPDFAADARAARILGDGTVALLCFTGR